MRAQSFLLDLGPKLGYLESNIAESFSWLGLFFFSSVIFHAMEVVLTQCLFTELLLLREMRIESQGSCLEPEW